MINPTKVPAIRIRHLERPQSKNCFEFGTRHDLCLCLLQNSNLHRKKLASVGAANQVFFVVTKSAGTAPTASASGKLAARTVTQIKVLICLNHCISLGVL
jgi:hypothetical protein